MKALAAFLAFVLALPSGGQIPRSLLALPVGPAGPGGGPWEIKVWPYEGCKDCVAPPEDAALYATIRDAMLSGDYRAVKVADVQVQMVRLAQGQEETSIALSDLHQRVQNCKLGSQGLLPSSPTSRPGTSFGVGLDCPDHKDREFLSITIVGHRVANIYYLPDAPVWVLNSDAAKP